MLILLPRYEGDATDLCLDFSIEDDTFGARTLHSLLPGGAHMAVTNANKLHYIHLAADWHLNGRLGASSAAFAKGMAQVGDTLCRKSSCAVVNNKKRKVQTALNGRLGGILCSLCQRPGTGW